MEENEFQYNLINLQQSLMKFAYRLTSDKDDAKDLVQDTLLKALKYCEKFDQESNIKAWTYTIMKNTFINNHRTNTRHNHYYNRTEDGFYPGSAFISYVDNPDSIYSSKELEKSIETLDDDFRLPFKMYHEGFMYKEIAETLELNLGTVKSRIYYARRKLAKVLNE